MLSIPVFSLELMTLASRNCAETLSSSGAVSVLVELITQTNRSSASLSVVKTILKILLNLCKVFFSWRACRFDWTSLHVRTYVRSLEGIPGGLQNL